MATANPTYKQLMAQIAALQTQAKTARPQELADLKKLFDEQLAESDFTIEEMYPEKFKGKATKAPAAPKADGEKIMFKDPDSDATWGYGKGKPPGWFSKYRASGKHYDDLLVDPANKGKVVPRDRKAAAKK